MSYPKIGDDNFNNKIYQKYKKYVIPKKKKTFEQICFSKKFELQIPQKFLAEYINPNTDYKAILIFHQIGSGKTCTAINIGEQWKKLKKIVVVVPASLIGNFKTELRSKCTGNSYLKPQERELLVTLHPTTEKYKEIIKKSDERIKKYYDIYSYNKFIKYIESKKIKLRNVILIIDEIQNMISERGKYYKVLYNAIHSAPADLRIILLSATPIFDKPNEIALTMNLLRIPFELPTGKEFERSFILIKKNKKTGQYFYKAKNLDIFKERIRGFVSYYRGSPPYVFPLKIIKYVKCEMSEFQYRSYITVLSQEEKQHKRYNLIRKYRIFKTGEILNLPNNFFIGTRIISNIAFPNKNINESGYLSLKGDILELENIKKYSCKFYSIIKKINKATGPIFVYSNFKNFGGIKSFVKVLEAQGYKHYLKFGEGKKRYAIWSGDETKEVKEEIKTIFNQLDNYNGHKLKIIIGSLAAKEGISFKNVQQVHIMEPYWNWSRMEQIIGRAYRTCSHAYMPEEKRVVKVYIYIATYRTEKETIDQYIMNLALQKKKLIQEFENALKEVAIDCKLFKNANVYEDEKDIKCEP